jgi:uncharacterized membrane protein
MTDSDYPPEGVEVLRSPMAAVRLVGAVIIGLIAAIVAAMTSPWQTIPLLAWDAASVTWLLMLWSHIVHLDAMSTSALAVRQEPRRATRDLILLTASVASLVAVALGLIKANGASSDERTLLFTLAIITIVVSWAVVHTVFALRYAGLYYRGPDGGIQFNEDDKPCYLDFAYLAFTIGMTYQVSDTNLTSKAMRHTALRHALLSYLFGTVIIAATINLGAGLLR